MRSGSNSGARVQPINWSMHSATSIWRFCLCGSPFRSDIDRPEVPVYAVSMNTRHRVLGIVEAGGKGSRMDVFTRERAKPSLPYPGSYQLIDFALTSIARSSICDVWASVEFQAGSWTFTWVADNRGIWTGPEVGTVGSWLSRVGHLRKKGSPRATLMTCWVYALKSRILTPNTS